MDFSFNLLPWLLLDGNQVVLSGIQQIRLPLRKMIDSCTWCMPPPNWEFKCLRYFRSDFFFFKHRTLLFWSQRAGLHNTGQQVLTVGRSHYLPVMRGFTGPQWQSSGAETSCRCSSPCWLAWNFSCPCHSWGPRSTSPSHSLARHCSACQRPSHHPGLSSFCSSWWCW